MEIYESIALAVVTNFAGYGFAWAAVTQWGYTGQGLDRISWRFRHRWDELSGAAQTLIFMALSPLIVIAVFLFFVSGIFGFVVGFGHAETAHLKLTGQFYLGEHREKEREFERNIVPRLNRSFESEADCWSAKRLALPMYLSQWLPEPLESEPSNDEEFYDLFVLCFQESLDPASDLAKNCSTAWIKIK